MRTDRGRKPVEVSAGEALSVAHAVQRALAVLDDQHVVIWADKLEARDRVAAELQQAFDALPETQSVPLEGKRTHDLKGVRGELDATLRAPDEPPVKATFDGPGGLLSRLREAPAAVAGHHVKRRYYLWRDADELLIDNPETFGVMVDAIVGVAAESEFASDDLLLIQRLVLIGGPALREAAGHADGPLRAWRPGSPWAHVTGVAGPSFVVIEAC